MILGYAVLMTIIAQNGKIIATSQNMLVLNSIRFSYG